MIDFTNPPPFDPGFLAWAKRLADPQVSNKTVLEFIEYYGTHFFTDVTFGAKYVQRHKVSQAAYESLKKSSISVEVQASYAPGGVLPSKWLMGMCHWMGSHFHHWIDYNGVAFSIGANRVTRMGSHICGISGVSKFRQVGIWGIFAQK